VSSGNNLQQAGKVKPTNKAFQTLTNKMGREGFFIIQQILLYKA